MSEELEILKEYFNSAGLGQKEVVTLEDIQNLKSELRDAGEFGLVNFLNNLKTPNELVDYISED